MNSITKFGKINSGIYKTDIRNKIFKYFTKPILSYLVEENK